MRDVNSYKPSILFTRPMQTLKTKIGQYTQNAVSYQGLNKLTNCLHKIEYKKSH